MSHPLRINRRLSIRRKLHQVNPPARRIHLFIPQSVGRTHRQTKSAMHALVDNLPRRRMLRVKRTAAGCVPLLHYLRLAPFNFYSPALCPLCASLCALCEKPFSLLLCETSAPSASLRYFFLSVLFSSSTQIPPTNRPGFNVPRGSNCHFTALISGNASRS